MQQDVLLQVVDVWKSTFLSSRSASNRSRHVESHPGLDLGHADRCPLIPCVPGSRWRPRRAEWRRSGGGSSEGAAEVVSVSVWSEQRLARQAGRQGRAVVNDRLLAAAVAAV